MTVQEIREAAKVMEAYANGKKIQCNDNRLGNGEWVTTDNPSFNWDKYAYRIKPQQKYRPFKTQEECWNEMLKHQPFGWVKSKKSERHFSIGSVLWNNDFNDVFVTFACDGMLGRSSKSVFEDFTFADGTPFGIKEE